MRFTKKGLEVAIIYNLASVKRTKTVKAISIYWYIKMKLGTKYFKNGKFYF